MLTHVVLKRSTLSCCRCMPGGGLGWRDLHRMAGRAAGQGPGAAGRLESPAGDGGLEGKEGGACIWPKEAQVILCLRVYCPVCGCTLPQNTRPSFIYIDLVLKGLHWTRILLNIWTLPLDPILQSVLVLALLKQLEAMLETIYFKDTSSALSGLYDSFLQR